MSALWIYSFPAFPTINKIVAMTGIIDRTRFRWHKREEIMAGLPPPLAGADGAVWSNFVPVDDAPAGGHHHPVTRRLGGIDPLGFQNTTGLPETRRVVVVAF